MAKKFNVVYKVAKETAYAKEAAALVLAASLNSVIDFSPVVAPNGTVDAGAASAEYNIQRVKRIKGANVSNANAGTTAAALAALDTFSKVDWDTIGVATGVLRSVGVKTGINEEFDPDSMGEVHSKAVADSMNVQVIERHEALIQEAVSNAQAGGVFVAPTAAAPNPVFDLVTTTATAIMLKSDDFKHMTDKSNLLIIMHPMVANAVAKEIGTVFNQEAPIYTTGVKSRTSLNGIPVIVDGNLNKYDGASGKVIGALVLDIEALAFKAKEFEKPVNIDLGLTKFYGKYFYNIVKAVDPSRIYKIEYTLPTSGAFTAKTAKVSA